MQKKIKIMFALVANFLLVLSSVMPIYLSSSEKEKKSIVKECIEQKKEFEKRPLTVLNNENKEKFFEENYKEITSNKKLFYEKENQEKKIKKEIEQSSNLGIDWLEAENISKTIKVPAGGNYHAYFYNDTLYDMPYLDRTVGLPLKAKYAIERVPNWLKDDLADKFGELCGEEIDIGFNSKPAFADLDGDGDFDLTVGKDDGTLHYYENKGTPYVPIWVEDNLMYEGVSVDANSAPAFADLDNDLDYDLIVGCNDGRLYYFLNNGTIKNPRWETNGTLHDILGIEIDVGAFSNPALADMDNDGDADLTIGSEENMLFYYENTNNGWRYEPSFYQSITLTGYLSPALADLNDDTLGKYELTLGTTDGTLHYYEDVGTTGHNWVEDFTIYARLGEKPIKVEAMSTPAFVDINGDSLYDLFVGQYTGVIDYFRNGGTARMPHFLEASSGLIYNEETQNQMFVTVPALALAERQIVQFRNSSSEIATRYAKQILNEDKNCSDEIGFSIAHTATRVLKRVYPGVFGENARLIYEQAPLLDYVEIVEKNNESKDYYTTLKYYVNESGVLNEYELPRDIYYWWVVHPKITDEDPTYIDPDTGDPAPPPTGKFWRDYLFNHADDQYPYDNADDQHEYPHDMDPPLLKEKLKGIKFLWHCQRSRTSNGHNDQGLDNKRWFDARYRILYANMTDDEWEKKWLAINTGTDNDPTSKDRKNVSDPCVIKTGLFDYKMWYAGYDGYNWRIFFATSNVFDGRQWSKKGLVLDVGVGNDKDNVHVRHPSVIYDINDKIYKMWYAGYDGSHYRIFYATSSNGENWEKHGVVIDIGKKGDYDSVHATEPMVIKEIDGYKMWYTGYDGKHSRILYATSLFGDNWVKHGVVIDYNQSINDYDSKGVGSPAAIVEKYNEDYRMWYTGYGDNISRILYATSSNGENWEYKGLALDVGTKDRFPTYGRFDYPKAISPTIIKDVVDNNVTYKMWYVGLDGYHDQALEQVSNWVAKTLPLNQQEVDDTERPIQPVRIAHHHNGNCGELQDLGTSAGRTALIPSQGAHDLAEDHVWMHFWDRGWHQWDTFWSDSSTIIDDYDQYKYGWNKDISAVWIHRGDDHVFDVSKNYFHSEDVATVNVKVVDRFGNPVDGARVIFGSHWLSEHAQPSIVYGGRKYYVASAPFLSFWNYTDTNGECVFYLGFNNYSVDVMSRFGSQGEYHLTQNNGGMPLMGGKTYNFEYILDGAVPRPNNPRANKIDVKNGKNYKIEVKYKVLSGEQHVPNLLEGTYHPQIIPTNNDIDFYICNESNYKKYLKGYLDFECALVSNDSESGDFEFILPDTNDKWYIIFSNTQPTETAKVVDIEIKKYVRDFSISIEEPENGKLFELGEVINVSGKADGIVSSIEINVDNSKNWFLVGDFDAENWYYNLDTKELDAGEHLIIVRANAGGSRYKYANLNFNLWAITIENPNNGSKFDIGKIVKIDGKATTHLILDKVEVNINNKSNEANYEPSYSKWSFNFNTSGLLSNVYNISVKAYYNGLKENVSIEIELADLSCPEIVIKEPKNEEEFSVDSVIEIKGTASDNTGVKKVEVKIDDNGWSSALYDDETENWKYEWNTNGYSIGEHTIYAHSVDNYGHTSQVASIKIKIYDDVLPQISIEKPKDKDVYGVGKIIEISGKASDNYKIDKVEIIINESTNTANYNSKNNDWNYYWDTSELALGEYQIVAKATDEAKNYKTDSIKIKLVDKTFPIIKINENLDNITVSLGDVKTISGSVSDNIRISKVEININGTWDNATLIGEQWSYNWNTTNLTLGKYKIYAKAIDSSNNSNLSQKITIYLVDEKPPTITIYPLLHSYGIGEIIKIKGKADDNTGVDTIKILAGIQWRYVKNYDNKTKEWSYDWNTEKLKQGTYYIKVKAIDNYDNEEETSISIKLLDKTPPEIKILKPNNNSKFEVGGIVEIEGTVKDETAIDFIEISFEEGNFESVKLNGESWSYEWNTMGLKKGRYNIVIKAKDTNGNENNVSITLILEKKEKEESNKNLPILVGIIGIVVVFVLILKFKSSRIKENSFDKKF